MAGGRSLALSAFSPLAGITIPIFMSATPNDAVGGVDTLSVTIRVNQTGDYVQLGTTHPGVVNSPSFQWPHNVSFPSGGSDTRTITLTTNGVTADTPITIYVCPSGVDPSNPNNWTASQTVTVRSLSTVTGGGRQQFAYKGK